MMEPPGVTEPSLLGTQTTEIAPVSSPPHSIAQQRSERAGRSGRNSSNVIVEQPSPEPPEIQVVPPKLKQECNGARSASHVFDVDK